MAAKRFFPCQIGSLKSRNPDFHLIDWFYRHIAQILNGGIMFGLHKVPLRIEKEGVSLRFEKEGEVLLYKRECRGEKVEKTLLTSNGKILINPIEPLNKPKEITPYLLIDFEKTLLVEPKITREVFLTFPLEIGVFMSQNEHFEICDILTITKQKFTLYGDPRSGVICRYWRSEVYPSIPSVNLIEEGIVQLNISNTTTKWVEVSKAVFNAYGMKIYYNDKMVFMKANMKVMSKGSAETDFIDSPLEERMKKSLELYTTRKLAITTTKFMMEAGL